MDRKFEREKQALIKIGIPEELAYIIVSKKLNVNEDEVNYLINDIKEQQKEIMDFTKEFKPLHENLISNDNNKEDMHLEIKIKPFNKNLISIDNNIDNVEIKDKTV